MSDKFDRQQKFRSACAAAEAALRDILKAEHHDDFTLAISLVDSPLKPWLIAHAECLLIFTVVKRAFFLGHTSGRGILFVRLPTEDLSLIKWSAPLFVTASLRSFGLSFGRLDTTTFAVGMGKDAHCKLLKRQRHRVEGLELHLGCHPRLVESAGIFSAVAAEGAQLVGVSKVAGCLWDLSYARGHLKVDAARHAAAYGNLSPQQVVTGAVSAPSEMQPLYSEVSLMVQEGLRPSAGLHSGLDPEQMAAMASEAVAAQQHKVLMEWQREKDKRVELAR